MQTGKIVKINIIFVKILRKTKKPYFSSLDTNSSTNSSFWRTLVPLFTKKLSKGELSKIFKNYFQTLFPIWIYLTPANKKLDLVISLKKNYWSREGENHRGFTDKKRVVKEVALLVKLSDWILVSSQILFTNTLIITLTKANFRMIYNNCHSK